MTILRERITWKKPRSAVQGRSYELTVDEQRNVRAAFNYMRARMGGARLVAEAIGIGVASAKKVCAGDPKVKPNAGMAIRIARLAGVPIEDVLAGRWPVGCPHCGR